MVINAPGLFSVRQSNTMADASAITLATAASPCLDLLLMTVSTVTFVTASSAAACLANADARLERVVREYWGTVSLIPVLEASYA